MCAPSNRLGTQRLIDKINVPLLRMACGDFSQNIWTIFFYDFLGHKMNHQISKRT